jgi:hypothetical protein
VTSDQKIYINQEVNIMTLKELQAHETRITNLETRVNELVDAVTEINIAINIIMTYVCARDHLILNETDEKKMVVSNL